MAINIEEKFEVQAPVDAVWQFLMDPQRVVACMPGAELEEVVDERTFLGNIKVKVGPITTKYKGRVQFTEVDEQGHTIQMTAEGRETGGGGGGTAKGMMSSRLTSLSDGMTEVATEAKMDVTGRVMQFGRGMIQGVSHELFLQFVACAKQQLEAPEGAAAPEAGAAPAKAEAISAVPLFFRVLWSSIVRLFRRLTGRPAS